MDDLEGSSTLIGGAAYSASSLSGIEKQVSESLGGGGQTPDFQLLGDLGAVQQMLGLIAQPSQFTLTRKSKIVV